MAALGINEMLQAKESLNNFTERGLPSARELNVSQILNHKTFVKNIINHQINSTHRSSLINEKSMNKNDKDLKITN